MQAFRCSSLILVTETAIKTKPFQALVKYRELRLDLVNLGVPLVTPYLYYVIYFHAYSLKTNTAYKASKKRS